MSQIEWGPEIPVTVEDGKIPSFIKQTDLCAILDQGEWIGLPGYPASEWEWTPTITAVRLPADHDYYRTQQLINHAAMVTALVKPGADILATLSPEKVNLLHAAVGISGEAGELLDGVKKHVVYNKPMDRENLIEELGDLEFYMEQLRQQLGVTREETLLANINKLSVRYAAGYSDQAAQQRADKQ